MLVDSFYPLSLGRGEGKWVLLILQKVGLKFFYEGEARWKMIGRSLE